MTYFKLVIFLDRLKKKEIWTPTGFYYKDKEYTQNCFWLFLKGIQHSHRPCCLTHLACFPTEYVWGRTATRLGGYHMPLEGMAGRRHTSAPRPRWCSARTPNCSKTEHSFPLHHAQSMVDCRGSGREVLWAVGCYYKAPSEFGEKVSL